MILGMSLKEYPRTMTRDEYKNISSYLRICARKMREVEANRLGRSPFQEIFDMGIFGTSKMTVK